MEKLTDLLAERLEMGGFGAYVWPSYLVATLLMVVMAVLTFRSWRRASAQIQSDNET